MTDAALVGTATTPKAEWTGLDHLEGQTVKILADGIIRDDRTVIGGAILLDQPASRIEAGLAYTHEIERSEEHTSELQSLMRISYAVFCLKKKTHQVTRHKKATK